MRVVSVALILVFATMVVADIYMHNCRGSNNRLIGQGANRENNNRMCDTQNNAKGGYVWGPPMYYYEGSQLTLEWTNQHGCGHKTEQKNVHCEVVIQYMCGDEVRDGVNPTTIPDNEATYNTVTDDEADYDPIFGDGPHYVYGMHESYQYYQHCKVRERNRGLFIADRNLNGNTARFTRQNNNGGRSGFECPEEKDYYPYWHPTPWKDIAVLTYNPDRCDYYIQKSENNRGRNYCSQPQYNNKRACKQNGGKWRRSKPHDVPSPECLVAPHSRDNHLGNGPDGVANTFNWTIPRDANDHCVLRMRYNITTGDYDGWDTYASKNGQRSPIKNDPDVNFGGYNLTLAVDTSQFGRTFQDRSHTFEIKKRPDDILDTERMFNLNVRGKRGNIVQAYPACEYDYVPNLLTVREGDWIHFQWTGGNHNPAGNDGEGRNSYDRTNMVEMGNLADNVPYSRGDSTFFSNKAMKFAHLDQHATGNCLPYEDVADDDQNLGNCMKLNAASPYFDGGLKEVTLTGTFYFMSTRNNNFSNRSQKSTIVSVPFLPVWAIVLIVFGSVLCLLSIAVSGLAFYGKARPQSVIGRAWTKLT